LFVEGILYFLSESKSAHINGQDKSAWLVFGVVEIHTCEAKVGGISLGFWPQRVYHFLVVGGSALNESTGAIWMKEEDLPR